LTSENNLQKKCGFCGENIPVGARRCPYCGSILEVTFDNSCKIGTSEGKQAGGENLGQVNTEQPVGQDADIGPNVSEKENMDEQGNSGSTGIAPPVSQPVQQTEFSAQMRNAYKPYTGGGYPPNYNYNSGIKEPLSNGMKVFLTVLFTVLPGIGQLAGIIAAIVFMNSEGDSDRKSFGVALLVASLVMFVISCIGCFILVIALSANQAYLNY
jgi:hypothetical protein